MPAENFTAVELTQELVRIPSVNPDGAPGADETGEKVIAEHLSEKLTNWGAETELREVLPGRPNLLAKFPTDKADKPRLLFAPHLDTVSIKGMTIDPFAGELREGKIWGRGSSDTKGPMAAMLTALHRTRDVIPELSHEIWFAGLMGEEAGQQGSRALGKQETFDFAIVGEPTDSRIVHTHKGSIWLEIKTKGKAVHASLPDQGINAIYAMADLIGKMQTELAAEFDSLEHEVLGKPTFSVGWIRGGSKTNIVADECTIGLDLRTVPALASEEWLAELKQKLSNWSPGLEITQGLYTVPLDTDPDHEMIRKLSELGAEPTGAPWFCDASILSLAGTPAVAMGPGSINQAHTADEWIDAQALEEGAAFFERFLRSLG